MGIINLIESCGANVVLGDFCTECRYFINNVNVAYDDPIEALADYYLPISCSVLPPEDRYTHFLNMLKTHKVNGAICLYPKYCIPFIGDYPLVKRELVRMNIPCLALEIELPYLLEQLKTRIETFIEVVKEKGSG